MENKTKNTVSASFIVSEEVKQALDNHKPLVALETAVISHGLPKPINLELGRKMEKILRDSNVTPATIAILDGRIHVGLSDEELIRISTLPDSHKSSSRDLGIAISSRWSGGTTVAATLVVAANMGIKVFCTGGIGGVHRGNAFDISADLFELSRNPVIVICSGAKAILDMVATQELLETFTIPVLGYQTDKFPAFFSSDSGISIHHRVEKVEEIIAIAQQHWSLGIDGGILVTNPPPKETEIPFQKLKAQIDALISEAERQKITGNAVTPFLLQRLADATTGATINSNLALLESNAHLAARIAKLL